MGNTGLPIKFAQVSPLCYRQQGAVLLIWVGRCVLLHRDVHPLWDIWFSRMLVHLRETEKNYPNTVPIWQKIGAALCGTDNEDDREEAEQELHFLAVQPSPYLVSRALI